MAKQELILAEMRVLTNDPEFGEAEARVCGAYLRYEYLGLTNRVMELLRLVTLDEFTRDAQNISTAIDDFLSSLHDYAVNECPW